MRILIASSTASDKTEAVADALRSVGHDVPPALHVDLLQPDAAVDVTSDTGLVLALVPVQREPETFDRTVALTRRAEAVGVPSVGLLLCAEGTSAAVPALSGPAVWVEMSETADRSSILEHLARASAGILTDAMSADPRQHGLRSTLRRVRASAPFHATSNAAASARKLVMDRSRRTAAQGQSAAQPVPDVPRASIFVSYSSEDNRAKDVVAELRRLGFTVWMDQDSILGADDIAAVIERGIRATDAFVLLLSGNVTRRPDWVKRELSLARSEGKKIVPVRLTRDRLPDGFPLILAPFRVIDLFPDFSAGVAELAHALGAEGVKPSSAVTARVRRQVDKAMDVLDEHDVVEKLGLAAATLAAGLAAGAIAATGAAAERSNRARMDSVVQYVQRVSAILERVMRRIGQHSGMSLEEYREELRPELLLAIGELKGILPVDQSLDARHTDLISGLQSLMRRLDVAAQKGERGDMHAYQRAEVQARQELAEFTERSLAWLHQF